MKKINLYEENSFSDKAMTNFLVHESPYFKILNFNFREGQELPVHSHDIEGQLSIVVLEGDGWLHVLQDLFSIDYISKLWGTSKQEPWPEKVVL